MAPVAEPAVAPAVPEVVLPDPNEPTVFAEGRFFATEEEQVAYLTAELERVWKEMHKLEPLVVCRRAEEIIRTVLKDKAPLIATLGLDGTLRKKFTIVMNNEELLAANGSLRELDRHYLRSWLKDAGFDLNTLSYVENKICNKKGQCTKLSRAISSAMPSDLAGSARDYAQRISGAKAPVSRSGFVAAISTAFRGNADMFISANPTDLIASTFGGGFTSCHRPGGEYFGGNIGLALTPSCFLGYTGSPAKKTGRMWMYYLEEAQHLYQLKTYGVLPQQWRSKLRHVTQDVIDINRIWVHSTNRPINTKDGGNSSAYVDTSNLNMSYGQEKGFVDNAKIVMGVHICPDCGAKGNAHQGQSRAGGCRKCEAAPRGCKDCGEPVGGEQLMNSDGHQICKACFEKLYYVCPDCGGSYLLYEEHVHTRTDGKRVCHGCFDDSYVSCADCGIMHHYQAATLGDDDMYRCSGGCPAQ